MNHLDWKFCTQSPELGLAVGD